MTRITFNCGLISGGTGVNVVLQSCVMELNHRYIRKADGEEMEKHILALKAHNPDVTLEITGGISRPPMELTDGIMDLFNKARAFSLEQGLDL